MGGKEMGRMGDGSREEGPEQLEPKKEEPPGA